MGAIEFQRFGSLSRLFRDMTITEKLDGTNAAVVFQDVVTEEGLETFEFAAQSRNRIITPEDDNYGFAKWVHDNADELYELLGEGRHFGEWWGRGIQRNYGLTHRNFALFNTARYADVFAVVGGVPVGPVPVIYSGPFDTLRIEDVVTELADNGSVAAPGFMNPEGVVIYHHHSGTSFKTTLDNNDKHKWEAILNDGDGN